MTITTWIDTLTHERLTDADAERIREGFCVLAATRSAWPAPRDLLNALAPKPRGYFRALPPPEETPEQIAADRAQRVMRLAHVREILAPVLDAMREKKPVFDALREKKAEPKIP